LPELLARYPVVRRLASHRCNSDQFCADVQEIRERFKWRAERSLAFFCATTPRSTKLNGPFEIVVGHVHDLDDVKEGLSDAMDSLKKGSVTGAIRDIQHIRKGTGGWIRGAGTSNTGRIHLNVERLDSLKAGKVARIIVHEASHKFANTDDVTTTDVNGVEWVGYKWDGLRQDKANAAPHQNLENNADSYAWGGRLMWKRKRHHPNGI
jgi:hypothetical protein